MTDSQTPRPTLKLSIKPAILESLAVRVPKKTIVIPENLEPKVSVTNKKLGNTAPAKKANSQVAMASKPVPTPNLKQQKEPKKPQQPKAEKKIKEKIPPPVKETYDFFEVYAKLHTEYREVISIKNPKALAIGIAKDIKQVSGLSSKNNKMWTAEYLRLCKYYKKVHVLGANRYNLQGEVVGTVTQEQCDARKEMFKNSKDKMKQKKQQENNFTSP